MKSKIKVVVSQNTIVLVYEKKTLNIQRKMNPTEFAEIQELLGKGDMDTIIKRFVSISENIKSFSQGNFTVDGEKRAVYFKGDTSTPMPASLVTKIKSHYTKGIDYQPLVRFWKKVLLNPNKSSREELFDFMEKNNIPLTDQGDIIVEKGVRRLSDGRLVDCHTGKVDNSIGMTVRMPVEMVDSDRRNECSNGLHVGAPDYVRNHWSSDVILTCTVSPEHVVSVPRDYGATKMRVCEYRIVGLAEKSNVNPEKLVYRMEDIFDEVSAVAAAKSRRGVVLTLSDDENSSKKAKTVFEYNEETLSQLSGKAIKSLIQAEFGTKITKKLKADIVSEAIRVANSKSAVENFKSAVEEIESGDKVYTEDYLDILTIPQIIKTVESDFKVKIQRKKKRKALIIQEAIDISKK